MENSLPFIKDKRIKQQNIIDSKVAAKVSSRICQLLPVIQEVQPFITGINTGMGTWSFNGEAVGIINEEGEDFGKQHKFEANGLENFIEDNEGVFFTVPINEALAEVVDLLNYLCGYGNSEYLNWSSWQDGFTNDGVLFIYSEVENKTGNPFSIPTKKYFTDNHYYKFLLKEKVNICWQVQNNKKSA